MSTSCSRREQGRKSARAIRDALARLDAGEPRDEEIAAACGVVVGVAGASLSVAPGEICVMMGLSGSGKSTLLRAANGLTAVTRGHVLIDDASGPIDVGHCGTEQLRRLRRERVAMVFQQFALLPWRTVADNVGLGLELRGEPAAERQQDRRGEARAGRPVAMGGPACQRAVRRHAAARGPGARVCDRMRTSC